MNLALMNKKRATATPLPEVIDALLTLV